MCFADKFMLQLCLTNLSPITTTMMTTTTNDMAVQNTLLSINNILPHKTCLKPRGMILNKGANFILFVSTHRAPTVVDLYIYVELNKCIVVRCPCGKSTW